MKFFPVFAKLLVLLASSLRNSVLLIVCLSAATASAQPLLVAEHDWTFSIGNARYGILQSNIAPGYMQRRTTVYCAVPLFTVSVRAEVLITLVLVPVAAFGTLLLMKRRTAVRD